MFGFGGGASGNGPIDRFRAHPIQGLLGLLAGTAVPGGGLAANAMFNRMNRNDFNQAAQQGYGRSLQSTTMDANSAMNAPLNGPLGQFDGQSGGQGLAPPGGGMGPQGGGFNPGLNYGNNYGQGSMGPQGTGGLLDFLGYGQAPPSPTPPGSFYTDPRYQSQGGGGGQGGGMQQAGPGYGGGQFAMLPGGGMNGFMNGASSNMMAGQSATTNGDWMQRIGSHVGQQGPGRTASRR